MPVTPPHTDAGACALVEDKDLDFAPEAQACYRFIITLSLLVYFVSFPLTHALIDCIYTVDQCMGHDYIYTVVTDVLVSLSLLPVQLQQGWSDEASRSSVQTYPM